MSMPVQIAYFNIIKEIFFAEFTLDDVGDARRGVWAALSLSLSPSLPLSLSPSLPLSLSLSHLAPLPTFVAACSFVALVVLGVLSTWSARRVCQENTVLGRNTGAKQL